MKKHGNFLLGVIGVAALALATGCSDDAPGEGNNNGGSAGTGGGATTGNELLTPMVLSEGWIGGEPTSAEDNPAGIQGAIYLYGDDGLSCTLTEGNPCTEAGCCLSGHTIIDSTFAAWGCGLGISLNDTGGDAPMKMPFAGPATTKFTYSITGTTGGNELRVGFTQFADTTGLVSPYKPIAAFDNTTVTGDVSFDTATYPTWCSTSPDCLAPPDRVAATPGAGAQAQYAHDIQFQIAGGERDGDFNFCITSLQVSE